MSFFLLRYIEPIYIIVDYDFDLWLRQHYCMLGIVAPSPNGVAQPRKGQREETVTQMQK